MRDVGVGDRVDQYVVTDVVARSGMASIFKAVDGESGGAVALKVPHVQYEGDVVFFERFQREEEIGKRVDHPHVVRGLAPREKSRMYLAMEWVEGRSLRAELRSSGALAAERALQIAGELCDALAYLHRNGIVHRDVKPENVLLVGPGGAVKLLDFGIALLESARRLTWAGLSGTIGTPDYMAPEQIRGRRGDARTDVYAVGTILYEMLTGRLPYDAPNAAALLHAKTHGEPARPRAFVRDIPASLEAIVLRAIARDPRDRHGSAEELLRDLRDPFAAVPRTRASPGDSIPRPHRRWARRLLLASLVFAMGLVSRAWLDHERSSAPARSAVAELRQAHGAGVP
ncbi:MAG TPA: serine/threonine-protein kinase [Anaeromyxobacteraceae bacterium]|nr:serine/threonine-protein kinase [Anaeromyxobacteraceae bacterium]